MGLLGVGQGVWSVFVGFRSGAGTCSVASFQDTPESGHFDYSLAVNFDLKMIWSKG